MNAGTKFAPGSEFGADEIELLSRQLAERGFYVIGCFLPPIPKSTLSQIPASPPDASPRR